MTSPATTKPILPWKTKLQLSLLTTLTDAAQSSDGTINRRLIRFLDYQAKPNPEPVNFVSSADTTVDKSRKLWFRLYTPVLPSISSTDIIPVVIFYHGGGFNYLSAASLMYDAVCRKFARKLPAYVVSVHYRLAPEHRYPSQYEDGIDVLKYLEENHDTLLPSNADLSRCFLAGDSAGANLAHNVAVRACRAGFQALKVIGLVSIQPYFGGEERTESEKRLVGVPIISLGRTDWSWKVFLPIGANRDHEAVNVSGPNAIDISGLDFPETLLFVGGFDPLQDWQRRYYEWLKKSGKKVTLIEYPNMIHAFYVFPEFPESAQLISQVKDFVVNRVSML